MAAITSPAVDWNSLDDSTPAGPYSQDIDEQGLRLLCLATIRQAVMDSRENDEQGLCAQIWLSDNARWWLRALNISRNWTDQRIRMLVFGDCQQKQLDLGQEDEEEEDL